MSILNKNWILYDIAPENFFSEMSRISPAVAQVLWNRGIKERESAESFLNPDYKKDLHDPFLLKDIKKARERIKKAINREEKILIYGDYDADGVCGATILNELLGKLGAKQVKTYIPHREEEGYGLNMEAAKKFVEEEENLLITIDCGSTNIEEVKLLQENGVDVIVVDHHIVQHTAHPALAHINPHREDDNYPFNDLCATGLGFKLAQALTENAEYIKWMLDLVAIATVADVMPLRGENRTLVKYGLITLAQTRRPGLQALTETSGIQLKYDSENMETNIDTFTLGFVLGPRLNAAGRVEHAKTAFKLLNSYEKKDALELASFIEEKNTFRRDKVKDIIENVEEHADNNKQAVVLGSSEWSIGILGIVAGRLVEKHNKPVFLYQKKDGFIMGSARSPEYISVVDILKNCADCLERFGGHAQAGGFKAELTEENKLDSAIQEFTKEVREKLPEEKLKPTLNIDAELNFSDVSFDLYNEINKLAPFGEANTKPVFVTRNVFLQDVYMVGRDKNHLKCYIVDRETGKGIKGIGFNFGQNAQHLNAGINADIVFNLDVNEWNGRKEIQLKLVDVSMGE